MKEPRIALLYGGISQEREVSLGSGQAAGKALSKFFEVDHFDIQTYSKLPEELRPERHVVFSTLHGSFGEDGTIQKMMDEAGVIYAGCDATSSALTFDKVETKRVMSEAGVPVPEQIVFEAPDVPDVSAVLGRLGESLVIKPVAQGSSVGLSFAEGAFELASALDSCRSGRWLIEPRIRGREATVGILHGEAMDIVEIRPKNGRFDYDSKYTKGMTEYIAPAEFNEDLTRRIRNLATVAFEACRCRDYARIDLMVDSEGDPFFLEINTLPGLKETSLLPMSAAGFGYDFDQLLQKLVEPALSGIETSIHFANMAARNPTPSRRRKSNTWKDIDQSVKPKAMSSASERRIWLGRMKIAGVILGIGAVVYGALQLSTVIDKGPELITKAGESMPIRSVEIETDGSLGRHYLLNFLNLSEDENLLSVDLTELKQRLERIPQVRVAEVERRFPDTLAVSIRERHPMARLLAQRANGEKLLLFVDEAGVVFEGGQVDPSAARTLPFLDGVSLKKKGDRFSDIEGIEPVALLLSEARAIAPHIYSRWRVLSLEKEDRVIARSAGAKEVVFDATEDFRQQLGRLDYILDYYRSTRIDKISNVDLTLGEQVPVRTL